MNDLGSRLTYARRKWHLSHSDLGNSSGVDAATIRQIEAGTVDPDETATQRLADVLCVYAQWVGDADIPMVPLWCMSEADQLKQQTGPGTELLPGFVIVEPGPWYQDDDGEWRVEQGMNSTL